MATNTPNINLYKKNPIQDYNETFNIDTMLNENWDKIDDTVGDIQNELTSDSIKATYESNSNTNVFTDTEKSKLAGIESGAEVNNLSDANATDLTDGGDSSLHYHSNDKNRANHTGSQLASTISNFFSTVRGTVLTGLSTATNSAITATDSLLSAFGKLQAQITSLGTSKLDVDANAASASKLKTARIIALTGEVTGSVSFDGSANKTINTTVVNSNIFKKQTDIGSGIDLNTITADGYYHQNSNASAAAGTNYPVDYAGMLTVKTNGDMVYQTYQVYNSGEIWTRSKYNSIWYSWRKVWDSLNDGVGSGLDSDKLDGQHGSYYLNMDNMGESSTKKVMTDSERTKLTGIQTGAQVNRSISDSVTSTSSTTAASSDAVKTAYDKGVQALNIANAKLNSSGGTITGDLSVQGDIKLTSSDSMVIGSEGNDYIKFNPSTDALEVYSNSAKTLEVSESTIKYEGNDIWHAGNDGNGSGLDADVVDGKHASGTLNTAEKNNLVNAINEVNSKTTALENELSNNINQQSLTLTNADPTHHVTAKQNCGVDVEIGGEMVVNLLGRDGDCENVNKWALAYGMSDDTSDNLYGSQCIKNTATLTTNYLAKDVNEVKSDKYYILSANIKLISKVNNYISLNIWNYGDWINRELAVTNDDIGVWQKLGLVFIGREGVRISVGSHNSATDINYKTDGIMLTEITQDEYNNLTVDQLLDKYPYTNSAQPLLNPVVEVCGKNLFDVPQNIKASGLVGDVWYNPVTLDRIYAETDGFSINIKRNESYYFSGMQIKGNAIQILDTPFTKFIGNNASGSWDKNVVYLRVKTDINGEFEFKNLMLEQGTNPTPYEPYKGGQIIFPTKLAKIDTCQDKLTYKYGVAKVDREVKNVVLDGSLEWSLNHNFSGFKRVIIPRPLSSISSFTQDICVKYDGKILKFDGFVSTESDLFYPNSNGFMFLTIADADSGWGEDYTPSVDEIKAYFNGWRVSDAAVGGDSQITTATPQANKVWNRLYCGVGTPYLLPTNNVAIVNEVGITESAPTTMADGFTPYQLYYALEEPIQEEIQPIILGDGVNLVEGQNTLKVKSGYVWEKANIKGVLSDTYFTFNHIHTPDSRQSFDIKSIVKIVKVKDKDNVEYDDTKTWVVDMHAFGLERAYVPEVDYDPQATYYVLYQVLQEDYNCQVQEVEVSYEDNIRGALNEAVEEVHNIQSDVSELQLANMDTNIKGDGERIERGNADSTGNIVFEHAFLDVPTILLTPKSSTTPYVSSVTATSFTLGGAGAYWVAVGK